MTIPLIEGACSDEWTDWTWDSILVEGANCREVIDNVVDMAHFFYIHFAFPTYFRNVFEGHIASQYLRTRSRPDVGGASNYADGSGETTLRSEASYFGPAYMIDNLWHDYHGMTMESVLINCHYPVTPTSFLLQWGAIVKRPPGLSDAQASRVAAKFADFVGLGFQQDVAIWLNKTRIDNPLLCAEDGPVYQVRRWYEQFYCDVADIAPDMVARYEFEIDTTRAVAGWEAEVAANLSRVQWRRCWLRTSGTPRSPAWSAGAAGRRCWPRSSARSTPRCSGPRRRLRSCWEFSAASRPSALVEGCGSLRDSIDGCGRVGAAGGVAALMAAREYFQVRVAEVVQETGDACSLVLDAGFDYRPGQFVTVRIPSDLCGSVARCYSLCSSPLAGERPAITVKRTYGGYASNWILDHVVAGHRAGRAAAGRDVLPGLAGGGLPAVRGGQRDHPGDVDPEVGAGRRARARGSGVRQPGRGFGDLRLLAAPARV